MVYLAEKADSIEAARELLEEAIKSGKALETFKLFLESQGGDASVVDHPERLPQAPFKLELPAKESGYVAEITADSIGTAAMILGAGRATKESEIDLSVGLVLNKKIGDKVEAGESLVTIYSNTENIDDVKQRLYEHIKVIDKKVDAPELIYEVITG